MTSFSTTHELTVKAWSKFLAREVLRATPISPLIGDSSKSIVHFFRETQKNAGDKITFGLRGLLTGAGVTSGTTLAGNEEDLAFYSDALTIDELHHAVTVPTLGRNINAQRVVYNLRSEAKDALVEWHAGRLSVAFFNQVCGNTAQSDTRYTGLNSAAAPTSGSQFWAGSATADESLTSTDTFDLSLIDKAVTAAKTSKYMRPVMVDGDQVYVMYLHPYQVRDMRTNTSTGQWLDIQKAVMQGGKYGDKSNPIFTGALGVYNGVVLREANDVTAGVNSTTSAAVSTVRRAVMLGAQAAAYAVGQNNTKADFLWAEYPVNDYEREFKVGALSIMGMKKTQFNSGSSSAKEDFATIVVSTYAAA